MVQSPCKWTTALFISCPRLLAPTFDGKGGVLRHEFGRISGKGREIIMVHAIAKYRPLVTRDIMNSHTRGTVQAQGEWSEAGRSGNVCGTPTAEFLGQAEHPNGDHDGAMTGETSMDSIEMHLMK